MGKVGNNYEEFYITLLDNVKSEAKLLDRRVGPRILRAHTILLFLIWVALVDAGVIVVKKLRQNRGYQKVHAAIMAFVTFTTVFFAFLVVMDNRARLKKLRYWPIIIHFTCGILMFLLFAAQISLGVATIQQNQVLSSNRLYHKFHLLHKMGGYATLACGKVMIILGIFCEQNYSGNTSIPAVLAYLLVVACVLLLDFFILYRYPLGLLSRWPWREKELDKAKALYDCVVREINSYKPIREVEEKYPDNKFFIF